MISERMQDRRQRKWDETMGAVLGPFDARFAGRYFGQIQCVQYGTRRPFARPAPVADPRYPRAGRRGTELWKFAAILLWCVAGCATKPSLPLEGPVALTAIHSKPWTYDDASGLLVQTAHYNIYTTVPDPGVWQSVAQVMEGALGEYQKIAPGVPLTASPMDCYLFATRDQWVSFTRRHTGAAAYIYLQINRGGYTLHDWYVAYFVGEAATDSVAAHEGWHQFVARHFVGRLPPFLEEGIATMFEDVRWQDDLPRWNLTVNRSRVEQLRRCVNGHVLYPLAELVTLHAGNIVNQSGAYIEAFYAEDWAFATFLWNGENGKYRPALRKLMSDTADGSVFDPTGSQQRAINRWNPAAVRPVLEHYLGKPLETIDGEFQQFIHTVAFDEYERQWD